MPASFTTSFRALVPACIIAMMSACSFEGLPDWYRMGRDLIPLPETPVATPTEAAVTTALLSEPTIGVYHGHACAQSDVGDEGDPETRLRLQQELALPPWATDSTVFLNGWQMRYLHSDEHVVGFATAIYNVSLDRRTNVLRWEAGGVLSDAGFDNGYSWCYRYTVTAWNASLLSAVVDHADDGHIMINETTGYDSALKPLSGFLQISGVPPRSPVAVLPRGVGLAFERERHLLQAGYNLDYSEKFIEHQKRYHRMMGTRCPEATNLPCPLLEPPLPMPTNYAEGFVSWGSKTVFKDNGRDPEYFNAELVSVLAGADVATIQPPFTLLPSEDSEGIIEACVDFPNTGVQSREVVTEAVPFEYAVSVLTAWELRFGCDNHHVREAGAWIDRFSYVRLPGAPGGTLRYTVSTLLGDDSGNGFSSATRAHVLGFRRIASPTTPTGTQAPQPGE